MSDSGKNATDTNPLTDIFVTRDAKVDFDDVRLTGQTRMKIEKVLEEQVNGAALRKKGFRPRYRLLFYGAAGTGKAQPLYANVLTPTGWEKMGNLKLGDIVLTPDGYAAPINGVFPQGEKEIVEVTLIDGRIIQCCEDHLWKVFFDGWTRQKKGGRQIPRNHCENDGWRVVTTKELHRLFETTKDHDYSLPLPIIDGPEAKLPTNPYWMGALLGNGGLTTGAPMFSSGSPETIERFRKTLPRGYQLTYSAAYDWRITQTNGKKWGGKSPLNRILRELGLMYKSALTKFIPEIYFTGSRKQRVELLRGLLDTDGTINKGCISYSTSSPQLAKDVQKLCWTLGYMCSIGNKNPTYTYKGVKLKGAPSFNLIIRVNDPKELGLIKAKQNKITKGGQYEGCIRAGIEKITYTGKKTEMRCISIDHPEHLYITDNYVVTHNTMIAEAIAQYLNRKLHIFNLEMLSGTDPDAALKTIMDALRIMNKSDDVFLFDEFDAIASARGSGNAGGAARQTSNALLIAFEQITSKAILICATNFLSTVDPAFRRRFDTICKFELPDETEREAIIRATLKKHKVDAPNDDILEAAKRCEGLSYHETEEVALCAIKTSIIKDDPNINLIVEIPAAQERRMAFKQTHDTKS
jgi:AAA+ superfamily predicted ATPase